MLCGKCGARTAGATRFCGFCGSALAVAPAQPAPEQAQPPRLQRYRGRVIAAGCVIAFTAVCTAAWVSRSLDNSSARSGSGPSAASTPSAGGGGNPLAGKSSDYAQGYAFGLGLRSDKLALIPRPSSDEAACAVSFNSLLEVGTVIPAMRADWVAGCAQSLDLYGSGQQVTNTSPSALNSSSTASSRSSTSHSPFDWGYWAGAEAARGSVNSGTPRVLVSVHAYDLCQRWAPEVVRKRAYLADEDVDEARRGCVAGMRSVSSSSSATGAN